MEYMKREECTHCGVLETIHTTCPKCHYIVCIQCLQLDTVCAGEIDPNPVLSLQKKIAWLQKQTGLTPVQVEQKKQMGKMRQSLPADSVGVWEDWLKRKN